MQTRPPNSKHTETNENQDIHNGVGRRTFVALIFLVFLCISGLGVDFAYQNQHIFFGKHAQELHADFYMPPKASQSEAHREGHQLWWTKDFEIVSLSAP